MRFHFALLSLFLLLSCFLSSVHPHAILQVPTARTGQAVGIGRKIPQPAGPTAAQYLGCGPTDGVQGADPGPGPITATYTAGQTFTVKWKITIDHTSDPGVRIAVRYSGADNFNNNILATGVSVQSNLVGEDASTSVTLPAGKTGANAVLQWIWYSVSDGGYYIACSDIRVNAAAAGDTTTLAPVATTTTDPDEESTTDSATGEGDGDETPISSTTTTTVSPGLDGGDAGVTTINPDDIGIGNDLGDGADATLGPTTTRRPTTRRVLAVPRTSGALSQYNTISAFIIASIMAAFLRY